MIRSPDYRGAEPSGRPGRVRHRHHAAGTVETWHCNHEHENTDEAGICARDEIVDRLAQQTGP